MAYCTLDDIEKKIDKYELIQATDDDDTGSVNVDNVDSAIAAADSEINGYLAGKYSVPLDPVPEILKTLAVDMSIYHIFLRRMGPPEHRKVQYDNSTKFLKSVAKGEIRLGVGDPQGSGSSEQPEFTGPVRVFSRDSMKGW